MMGRNDKLFIRSLLNKLKYQVNYMHVVSIKRIELTMYEN